MSSTKVRSNLGKQDLEKRMGMFLRAWRKPKAHFVVLRDQDAGDCRVVKKGLTKRCEEAKRPAALVHVACRELEAWIAGDLSAFAAEFSIPSALRAGMKSTFVNPDLLSSPVSELRKLYSGYQKRDGARRMGLRLDPELNASPSFKSFCRRLLRLTSESASS